MARQYVNLTPRWTEILPTWLMIYRQAINGNCMNPDLQLKNAREELTRMAQAADNYNDLVAGLRVSLLMNDTTIGETIKLGRKQQEIARTTIHEESES